MPMDTEEKVSRAPVVRNEDGTFPKGVSGNPEGRPKGSKNQITLLKESLELQLREQSASRLPEVLETAIELALQGDRSMLKLLLELHMSKGTSDPNVKGQEKVTINIKGPAPEPVQVLDVQYEEVTNEQESAGNGQ